MSKKLLRRIGALLVAFSLCVCTNMTAFAAENDAMSVVSEESVSSVYSSTLDINAVNFTTYGKTTLKLNTGNFGVTFYAKISTNSSTVYDVTITYPDGGSHTESMSGTGNYYVIVYLAYASAGTYTIEFESLTSTSTQVTGLATAIG